MTFGGSTLEWRDTHVGRKVDIHAVLEENFHHVCMAFHCSNRQSRQAELTEARIDSFRILSEPMSHPTFLAM